MSVVTATDRWPDPLGNRDHAIARIQNVQWHKDPDNDFVTTDSKQVFPSMFEQFGITARYSGRTPVGGNMFGSGNAFSSLVIAGQDNLTRLAKLGANFEGASDSKSEKAITKRGNTGEPA